MKKPQYVFDSNIFINMQRRQPPDIFPSLWKVISNLVKEGYIISCQEVLEEINIGSDELVNWAKTHKKAFLPSDEKIQTLVRDILENFESLITGSKKSNNADPFVIALAKTTNCILVTEETRNGTGQPAKIPNVCEVYKIKNIGFIDFLREQKITI